MGVINRVPRGLLGLLEAKTQGNTPPDLGSIVQPTLDLWRHYLSDTPIRKASANELNVTTPTYGGSISVPPGELWVVRGVNGQVVPNGITLPTGNWMFGVTARTPVTNQTIWLAQSGEPAQFVTATQPLACFAAFPDGFIFGPGTEFQTRLFAGDFSSVGTGVTIINGVNYNRLQV